MSDASDPSMATVSTATRLTRLYRRLGRTALLASGLLTLVSVGILWVHYLGPQGDVYPTRQNGAVAHFVIVAVLAGLVPLLLVLRPHRRPPGIASVALLVLALIAGATVLAPATVVFPQSVFSLVAVILMLGLASTALVIATGVRRQR